MGALNYHQQICKDLECPCNIQDERIYSEEQKLLNKHSSELDNLIQDQNMVQIRQNKGIYLFALSQNSELFKAWMLKFIDYHYQKLILALIKENKESVV